MREKRQVIPRGNEVRIVGIAIADYLQTYLEAAKTKFTKNYKGMNPSKITTTVGLNIGKIDIAGVSFNFWDLGGQEELQSLWDKVINVQEYKIHIIQEKINIMTASW